MLVFPVIIFCMSCCILTDLSQVHLPAAFQRNFWTIKFYFSSTQRKFHRYSLIQFSCYNPKVSQKKNRYISENLETVTFPCHLDMKTEVRDWTHLFNQLNRKRWDTNKWKIGRTKMDFKKAGICTQKALLPTWLSAELMWAVSRFAKRVCKSYFWIKWLTLTTHKPTNSEYNRNNLNANMSFKECCVCVGVLLFFIFLSGQITC